MLTIQSPFNMVPNTGEIISKCWPDKPLFIICFHDFYLTTKEDCLGLISTAVGKIVGGSNPMKMQRDFLIKDLSTLSLVSIFVI